MALTHDDYGVLIICALMVEVSAVRYMLDEQHTTLPRLPGDPNLYIYGRMGHYNVVIGYLPEGSQGKGAAAIVATHMGRTFPKPNSLHLLIGIGGGVPSRSNDIRLGDVVVSMPAGTYGGVVQYDLEKVTETGGQPKGFLKPPPLEWRNLIVTMRSDHLVRDNLVTSYLNSMIRRYPRLSVYGRPTAEDVLFRSDNVHNKNRLTCEGCDKSRLVGRNPRSNAPQIFYGLIASGDKVIKKATIRDEVADKVGGALCFEMEAAGLMDGFECLVIRGVSDYADSHKNDEWHHYAAATAAAYAKELLLYASRALGNAGLHNVQKHQLSDGRTVGAFDALISSSLGTKPYQGYYWELLTMVTFKWYNKIWQELTRIDGNYVCFDDFASYFHLHDKIPRSKVEEAWRRIITVWNRVDSIMYQDALFPKNLVFAALYMLHVETKYPHIRPRSTENPANEISYWTWRRLIRFDAWVPCACKAFGLPDCGSYWNYLRYKPLRKMTTRKECTAQKWLDKQGGDEPHASGKAINERNEERFFNQPSQLPRPYIT